MVDFAHGRKVFSGTTTQERHALLVEAVKLINARMSFGVAVSCKLWEIEAHLPKFVRGFSHAYGVCSHLAMTTLGAHLDKIQDPESVVYIFEAGHPYEDSARQFMKNAATCPATKQSYRHRGDSFLPKSDAVPLQAADLLAWEWAKCYAETVELPIREIRKSLRALFRYPKRIAVRHVTGAPLVKFLNQVGQLGLLQMAEQDGEGPVTVMPV